MKSESVGTVTRLRTGPSRARILVEGRDLSLLLNVQTFHGIPTSLRWMGTGVLHQGKSGRSAIAVNRWKGEFCVSTDRTWLANDLTLSFLSVFLTTLSVAKICTFCWGWMNEYGVMVEWYWQGRTEVQGEKHYTAWVVDEWMSMEQWWNDTDRGKLEYWEKNIIQRGW